MSVKWLADVIYNGFSMAFDFVATGWQALIEVFSNFEWFNKLSSVASNIGGIFTAVLAGIKKIFADTMNWIADKLSWLGIDIGTNVTADITPNYDNMLPPGSMSYRAVDADLSIATAELPTISAIAPQQTNLSRGGISQQIANANNSKSTSVGAINIYPQKVDDNFANYVEMHA